MNPLHAVENGGRNDIHHQRRAPILYEYVDNIKMNIFIVIIIWSLAYGCGNNEIDAAKMQANQLRCHAGRIAQ